MDFFDAMSYIAHIQSECFLDSVTVMRLASEHSRKSLGRMASIGITFSTQQEVPRKFHEFPTMARESVRAIEKISILKRKETKLVKRKRKESPAE